MSTTAASKTTRGSQFLDHGHVVVGVAAAILLSRSLNCKIGITLHANASNTKTIWIGKSGVTADSNAVTGGFPLTPGSSIDIPIAELLNIYAISDGAAQDIAWIGI